MLTKQALNQIVLDAVQKIGIKPSIDALAKIKIDYPEPKFGDYSSNAALMLAKDAGMKPIDLANKIIENIDSDQFEKIEIAGPGFINFTLKAEQLAEAINELAQKGVIKPKKVPGKILVEYFQPNIAKPLHIGHLRTAIIGDCIKRCLIFLGRDVESDTHLGDWGTQFGLLVLAYKKYGKFDEIAKDPINKLNELYIKINNEADADASVREEGKAEFVKLEKGDEEVRTIWQQFVDWSLEKFLRINDLMDILAFDHHWPESFYEDKMPAVVETLKEKKLLVESQGAQIVDLEDQNLGVAIIIKSDGGTTYLLRDLATFLFVKEQGFDQHLYVVDNRQSLHYRQLFAVLEKMGAMGQTAETGQSEAVHINYGHMSFKGESLSTRKGNIVLLDDVLTTAEEKVAQIIAEKNPDLADKPQAIKAVSRGALKFFDLSHNRHSDIDFDWDEALDFQGKSGPYLQYTYARFASILRKVQVANPQAQVSQDQSYKRLAFVLTIFEDKVRESMAEYLPNILALYLFELAQAMNHFYHDSPIAKETDEAIKASRYALALAAKNVLGSGLDLLGIRVLEEM